MRLFLVQHGEAVSKEVDPDRPLSEGGRQDVERLATFLAGRAVRAGRVVHSGKTRARQTAEVLAAALAPAARPEAIPGLDPNDPPTPIAEAASGWTEDVLVVGHLPFMDRLVALLVGGGSGGIVGFRPGSLVCLERADGAWTIAWMIRPELLRG